MGEQDGLTFERAFAELEGAVERLEAGGLTLEESLALFARARELAAFCEKTLEAAELRVRQLGAPDEGEPL